MELLGKRPGNTHQQRNVVCCDVEIWSSDADIIKKQNRAFPPSSISGLIQWWRWNQRQTLRLTARAMDFDIFE